MRAAAWIVGLLGLLAWAAPAPASDHANLEEGLPTRLTDAYPIPYRGRELQGLFRYEQTKDGHNLFRLEPRLEYGLAPNAQATLSVPLLLGGADKSGSGDIALEALYNLNQESLHVPAFALAARAEFPTGRASRGYDTTLTAVASKLVGRSVYQQLSVNLAWLHKTDPDPTERGDGYLLVFGYARALGADNLFIIDYVRERRVSERTTSNIVEVGLRTQLSPLTTLSGGGGADIVDRRSVIRGVIAVQRSF